MQSFPEYEPVSLRDDEQSTERDALLGTLLAGRYRIEALIGSGGMGAVYRAEHVHMRKAVAVKVLHKEMTAFPEVVARFEREAVAGGRIEHPHVVAASDFGQLEDGSFYLVLEFIEGQSLAKLVSKVGALTPTRALRITRQIVEALHAAHGVGIVHRDLKPDNVMLVDKDDDPDFVKVLDFGIAKIKVEETVDQPILTQIGTVFGTPEYMSPEQARGELVDARADLYTVGVILFEMLAGVSPFKSDDLVVLLTRHLTADPPPLPSGVDPMIRELVLTLLRKNPDERVQSAAELIDRIDLILGTQSTASFAASGARLRTVSSSELGVADAADPGRGFAATVLGETTPHALARNGLASALLKRRVSLEALLKRQVWLEALLKRQVWLEALLKRQVSLGKQRIPLWLFGAGALLSVLGIATLVVIGSLLFGGKREAATIKDDASNSVVAKDSQLSQLISRAATGDQGALAELSARPEPMRAGNEWLALGRGYVKLEQLSASLSAYQKGVQAKPELSREPALLSDVRRAMLDPQTSEAALKFAATSLGASGVDLLYDVWDFSKAVPSRAALSKLAKTYLDDDAVRAKASPALKLLLELGKAQKEGCASVKRWLARATSDGDARVVPALKRFDDRRGCGFLGLSDCYSCLRAGKDLGAAANGAAARPAPNFD